MERNVYIARIIGCLIAIIFIVSARFRVDCDLTSITITITNISLLLILHSIGGLMKYHSL